MKKPLKRARYTNQMAWTVWNQRKKRRQQSLVPAENVVTHLGETVTNDDEIVTHG